MSACHLCLVSLSHMLILAQSDGYYCECDPGWTGHNCDNDINECHSNPCRNSGTCVDTINGFYCECAAGFTGMDWLHLSL